MSRLFLELEMFCGKRAGRNYFIVKEAAAVDENGQTVLHLIVRPPPEVPADVELDFDKWSGYHHLSWDFAPSESVDYNEAERILKNFGNSEGVKVYNTNGVATPFIRSLGFPVEVVLPIRLRPAQGCAYHPETVYCALARAQLAVHCYRQIWLPALMDFTPATSGQQILRETTVADAPRETTAAQVMPSVEENPPENITRMDMLGRILHDTICALP